MSPVVSPVSKSQELSPTKPSIDNHGRIGRRRPSLRSRTRSRSRSFDKQVRSRSRDRKVVEREKTSRQYRNKSPPGGTAGGGIERRRYDRRGDNRSPKPFQRGMAHSLSKSRSRSPERRKISRSISPTDDSSQKIKRQRCRDFDGK